MAALTNRGIPLSSFHPRYLNTNSTSHTWPFSAVAELIDNAYDPDVNAKKLWIDKKVVKDQDCLIFMDNGNGIDYDKMHKMLSFGFSDKQTVRGHVPVGQYGNGFKSGSMRLGKDAIVFSKKADTMCVGLLSQTYLEKIEAQNIIVPIVVFTKTGHTDAASEHKESLHDILKHSLFNTKEELLSEFSVIDRMCANSSGTCIIIWNLRRTSSGKLEFDFRENDIWIPYDVYHSTRETPKREAAGGMSVPESEYSLRAYCSILYLKPRMQIILQGQNVETVCVIETLAKVHKDTYKPTWLPSHKKGMTITFGYNTKSAVHYGLMMYHKNRLIKAYERVACQRKADNTGQGVIGVTDCEFLTPTHNKQDFDNTDVYRNTIRAVDTKLKKYWEHFYYPIKAICTKPFEDTGVQNQRLQQENRQQQSPSSPTSSCQTTPSSAVISSSHTGADSRPSNKTSVDTPDTHLPFTSIRKKGARDQNKENPAKMKAIGKSLGNIPDFPTTSQASTEADNLPAMFLPESGAISSMEAEGKDVNNVDKSTVEKEQSSEIAQSISEKQQNYKVQYLQAMEEVRKLQCKVDCLEKEKITFIKDLEKLKLSRLRLRELRQKVTRFLVTRIPALDLQQVNYDCEVIDEILTQVIDEIAPTETAST